MRPSSPPGAGVALTASCPAPRRRWSASGGASTTGPGIPPEDRARLFEPYFQSRVSAHNAEGTGLGLAISRRLVELMGGTMGCESEPGKGSLFWVEVPLPPVAAPEPAPGAEPAQREPLGLRVLIVEDNRQVNQDGSPRYRLLEHGCCQVTIAADGTEALAAIERESFDVILMDCQMPGMTASKPPGGSRHGGPVTDPSSSRSPLWPSTPNGRDASRPA